MPADPLAGFSEEATPAATPTPDALAGFEEAEPPRGNSRYAKQGPWQTELKPDEEAQFQHWVKSGRSPVPFDPSPEADYDLRGYWKGLKTGDPRATSGIDPHDGKMHVTDTWKTPYHKSFSNESKYANDKAPRWVANRYLVDPESGTPIFDDKTGNWLGYSADDKGNPLPYNQQYHGQDAELQARERRMGQDPNWEGGHGIKPLGAPVGPEIPTPTAQQEALSRPLDSALIPAAGVAAGLATGGVVPTLVGTGLAAATAPAFRENVGKPVENLVSKVLPQAAPYAGQLAEMGAGMGLGAGMGEGTSAGRVTMEDAPAAPISSVERAQASEAEIVPDAQAAPQNGAQRLLSGPAASPEPGAGDITEFASHLYEQMFGEPLPEGWQISQRGVAVRPLEGQVDPVDAASGQTNLATKSVKIPAPAIESHGRTSMASLAHELTHVHDAVAGVEDGTHGERFVDKFKNAAGKVFQAPSGKELSINHMGSTTWGSPDYQSYGRYAEAAKQLGRSEKPIIPVQSVAHEEINLTPAQQEQFTKGVLGAFDKGEPGLQVEGDNVVYRAPDGTPVAGAIVENGHATGIAADKTRGLLGPKAAIEVGKKLKELGYAEPIAGEQMTPDSLNLMERGKQAEAPPTSIETKPKTDAEYEAEAKASNREKNARIKSLIKAPAIKMGDKVYAGETGDLHGEIYMRHPELVTNLEHKPIESGFIDHEGNFLNQQQAAEKADVGMVDALNLWPEEGPQDASKPISAEEAPSSTQQQGFEGFQESNEPAPQPEQDPFKRADVFEIPTKSAILDPETFQYKVDVDPKTGVGKSLSDASKYNPDFAGVEEMWYDDQTGKFYVSHGHHRHNLALKSDAPSVRAVILDSGNSLPGAIAHNVSKEEARTRGALINFSEGRGTVVDAANYLRNAPDMTTDKMKAMGLDLGEDKMAQAVSIRNLTAPVWYQTSIGKLRPDIAAIIGKHLDKPLDQIQAMKAYQQTEEAGRPFSAAKFDDLVQLIKNSQVHHGTTKDLFGEHEIARSTFPEQADILGNVRRGLTGEGKAFGTAAKKKDLLEKGQNVINAESSKALSKEALDRVKILNKYTRTPGTLSNIVLQKFAAHLAEKPSQRKAIIDEATEAIIKAIDKENPGMPEEQPDEKTGSLF